MLSDLLPTPASTFRWIARHIAIAISAVFALGMAGVGTGRNVEANLPKTDKVEVQPIVKKQPVVVATTELMHDAPVQTIATPSINARPSLAAQTLIARHRGRIVMMQVTAYCPCPLCCGANTIGITASGKHISYNGGKFVAADTSVLPFGTKVVIPGYDAGPVEVIDRGGAIKGNRLDLFFPTHEQALKWGRQMVAVTVID